MIFFREKEEKCLFLAFRCQLLQGPIAELSKLSNDLGCGGGDLGSNLGGGMFFRDGELS